jgi:hypothetical protein
MSDVAITIGPFTLSARYELDLAPRSCATFSTLLPLTGQLLQARWSGQAAWLPLGAMGLPIPPENATSYPAVGEILLYPGGVSETELLFAYGPTRFASKAGQLAGNHFLTIVSGAGHMPEIGRLVVFEGAQPIAMKPLR